MKIKLVIFLLFLVKTHLFCDISDLSNDQNIIKIFIQAQFSEDIKINKKNIFNRQEQTLNKNNDATGDQDTTSDIEKKYKLDKNRIEFYKAYESFFNEMLNHYMERYSLVYVEEHKTQPILIVDRDNSAKANVRVKINIHEYNEGEFNIIRNLNTELKMSIEVESKSKKYKQKKNYKLKPDIDKPLEKQRIEMIARLLANDVLKFLKFKIFKKAFH